MSGKRLFCCVLTLGRSAKRDSCYRHNPEGKAASKMMRNHNCITTTLVLAFVAVLTQTGECLRCGQCDTDNDGWGCVLRPQPAQDCQFPHCITVAKYSEDGKLMSFSRSCSPLELPEACVSGQDRTTNESVTLCYKTCSTALCNTGHSLAMFLRLLGK